MTLQKSSYGRLPDGTAVDKYSVSTAKGITAQMITYGGVLTSLAMPDRRGRIANVNLGFDTLEEYLGKSPYFGALVGRFANRIAKGSFAIEGKQYRLACNDGPNHLHGGVKGFDKVVWKARTFQEKRAAGVVFGYVSKDGEEGFPGTLRVEVACSLDEEGVLAFQYTARSDKLTPVNLTQHSYWNLAGSGTVLNHQLQLDCPFFLPVDSKLLPTGEVLSVRGTPMDFTSRKPVGRDIARVRGGYDHCWVAASAEASLKRIAALYEPSGGRGMEVWTTMPGVQLYTGNFLKGLPGAGGVVYNRHAGLCLETEFFPDAVNRPHFPSCLLAPGQTYSHRTEHRFFVK